jgi:gamma-glutamyltranspeptidase/glutathione hydrolase
MLVHRARETTATLLDFFVAVPGRGRDGAAAAEMEELDVDFSGGATQVFRIGAASCAVPGVVAGLEEAHRLYGSLPWKELIEPAIALARDGIELSRPQAYLHAILDLILRRYDEGREIYGSEARLVAGDRLVMTDLAGTLEQLAAEGAQAMHGGELGRAIVEHVRERGGELTEEDLTGFRVVRRRPIRASFRGHEFLSNPPPSSGGVLIVYGLSLLDRMRVDAPAGSAEAMAALVEVMREQSRARGGRFGEQLYRGGLAGKLLGEDALEAALARMQGDVPGAVEAAAPGGTTHVSVLDAAGNAASLSTSLGSGSGIVVPGTGVQLNNMLGEYDLMASGRRPRAGVRLTSMMAPSIALAGGRPRLVVGSAGSVRLRGAILQVAVNVLAHGLTVEEAISRPRVHLEEPHVHCEGGADAAELDRLEQLGYDVVRWRRQNLYFGGAAAVEMREDGAEAAAGDPRRGGHGIVVT